MVNVAGGSRGCATCRRRKVKCDQDWPECQRCKKRGLVCGPYQDTVKVYTSGLVQGANSALSFAAEPSSANNSGVSQADWQLLGPSRFKADIQISYFAALVQKSVPVNDNIDNEQPWVYVSAANDETQVVYYAAAALGGLQVARIFDSGSQDFAKTSPIYSKAIQLLSHNIKHKQRCYSEGNIAATLLLYFYELAIGDPGQSWMHHHNGLARLIEFYGPERFKPWLARKHFMMSRPSIIFYHIETRQRSFLERSDWKHIPWSESPLPKLPMQRLLDVVADIPGLLQDSDSLKAQGKGADIWKRLHLFDRMLSTLGMLFAWRFQWEQDWPSVAYSVAVEPPTVLTHLEILEKYAAQSIWFTQFDRAHELALYNTALLLLMQLLQAWAIDQRMSEVLPHRTTAEGPLPSLQPLVLPGPTITPAQVFGEIYRSVSYFLHPSHSRSGFLAIFYPLWYCELYCNHRHDDVDPKVVVWKKLKRACEVKFEFRILNSGRIPREAFST